MAAISRLILSFTANLTALLLTSYLIRGFVISNSVPDILSVTLVITIVNLTIRPLIKLILSPLIFVTLGLFTVVINAAIFYVIDIYSTSITINGLWPLVEASHVIGLINLVINYAALYLYRGSDIA